MPSILLYWFAGHQQTSTVRPQKCGLFYVKFSAQSNGFGLSLKPAGSGQKIAKTKKPHETAQWRRSGAKG